MELAAPRVRMQNPEISVDVCEPDRGLAIATYRNLLLTIWTERHTIAVLQNVDRSMRKLCGRYPSGIGFLAIINKMHMMGEEERRFAANFIKGNTYLRGVANVYRDTGFATAVLRGILTGLTALSKTSVPLCLVNSVEGAAEWLLPLLPVDPERPTVAGMVDAVASLEMLLSEKRR